jgi:hypothetical protein
MPAQAHRDMLGNTGAQEVPHSRASEVVNELSVSPAALQAVTHDFLNSPTGSPSMCEDVLDDPRLLLLKRERVLQLIEQDAREPLMSIEGPQACASRRAYLMWDAAGAWSGQTYDAFAAGFSNTAATCCGRSEVDGATAEQRRWHLYSAKIARDSTE